MRKLTSVEDLAGFRSRVMQERQRGESIPTIVVSADTGAQASGVNDLIRLFKKHMLDRFLQQRLRLRITGCHGFCEMNPYVVVEPYGHFYPHLKMEDVPRVIDAALSGEPVEDLLYRDDRDEKVYATQAEIPFFARQTRTILGNNQKLDPIRIIDYFENGGYGALLKVLDRNDPDWTIGEVQASGIRGRGGAGFPTGQKWAFARKAGRPGQQKYVVCNADEGDPGAYMDRGLLEGNPHAIIEGMIIGGLAIGATNGIIYARSEYPLAIKHCIIALRQARDAGILGDNILGTGHSFDIEIVRGAGAFVCGEETAMIKSIEGYMGEPRQRPPFPIERGIYGNPTNINNVETWANIPEIINRGGIAFAKVGIPGNTGTKIFSLVGKIKNTGLVEVPLGTKLSDVVFGIGGGPVSRAKIKAVQTGGPSGGCIPASMFDMSIDYDSLAKAGSIMGSGGMIVMDDNTCMVDVAKYFMKFLKDESCGKCFTCRKGTQRMYEILEDVTDGKATLADLDLLEELALVVKDTSMCGLGQSAANPVLSMLRYFRPEFERHIVEKRCDAFVCSNLVGAPCQSACPLGTEAWRYVAHIANGEYKEAYQVIREANPFPSVCGRVCHHPCEERCKAGQTGTDPVAIRALKRFITDRIDPMSYTPRRQSWTGMAAPRVAVVGSGPAGLTAAHYLSLKGYRVTVFEKEDRPGGMLYCAIPGYRLPQEVIRREIEALLDGNITVRCNMSLGKQVSVDGLFEEGYKAVLLALGAHESKPLKLENEHAKGVFPSIEFLKAFNQRGESLARGRVGVIGGGNSAFDAARVALRQRDVESVTILYRRTREEMPAFAEEIEAADQEGIDIRILVTPKKVLVKDGALVGLECLRNKLGDIDDSGRQRPMPIEGSEFTMEFDTLVVAISEDSGVDAIGPAKQSGIAITGNNTVKVDRLTLLTTREGVFAAGDVVRGPNTVVEAIADGKRAARMIDRYVRGLELAEVLEPNLPRVYVPPVSGDLEDLPTVDRVLTPRAPADWRKRNFAEVEVSLSIDEAHCEARRCLRCDLEFTKRAEAGSGAEEGSHEVVAGGKQV